MRLEKSNTFFTFVLDATNTFVINWDQENQQWIKTRTSTTISVLGDLTVETNQINLVTFQIKILYDCPGQQPICKKMDTYLIKIHYQMDINGDIPNSVQVDISFIRDKNSNNADMVVPLSSMFHNITINIRGQTLLYGSDIGNVVFTIKEDSLVKIYDKCSVKILDVVKGRGDDLYDKLNNIYHDNIGVPLTVFYANLFLYAMLKYILAKLLYHKFSTKFLLRRYNKQFLIDLAKVNTETF